MVELASAELYDVADDGTAVGADHSENADGVAAILIGDRMMPIDLSDLATNPGMSCATGITPDASYVVGWYWEYDESSYYAQMYGMVVPFCYDVLNDRVSIPEVGERIYNEAAATAIKAVAPDRTLLGYEQSEGIHSIIWADEYTPFEYVHFEYDEQYNPVFSLGDTQNLFSQTGRFVYGKAVNYEAGQTEVAAAFDRETSQLYTFTGCSVTAMSDDGVAFINDVPFYLGTTSYVVDVVNDPETQVPIIDWMLDEHGFDLYNYIQDGVITIGASADGRTILGITNTDMGWLTYVIDLDGEPMPEI
jgi:hypothetical protein